LPVSQTLEKIDPHFLCVTRVYVRCGVRLLYPPRHSGALLFFIFFFFQSSSVGG